ncbi:hypothetical protein MWU49_12740 [Alcanivorax sp. S6407]|uniref:hypothetical protein n=1 Tax=Alcanivorax sp. S6407 TaxID=2926424 RepID=UPI001FF2D86A|nr:hypothetical protein [Alcanivorax sp. S6407]MCK0154578.1 hypothetical protein [Alcanivorax sp. S6407]
MTSKVLAAAALMLVTTASAWAESADGAPVSGSSPEQVELKKDAGTENRGDRDAAPDFSPAE